MALSMAPEAHYHAKLTPNLVLYHAKLTYMADAYLLDIAPDA